MPFPRRLLALATLTLLACGGGGGSAPDAPAGPALAISFPPAGSATDLDTLTVTGTTDPEGPGPVVAVLVAGVPAISADEFATWRADVHVVPGTNDLVVEASNAEGTTRRTHRVVRVETMVAKPDGLGLDPATNRAWVVDRAGQLVEFDLATGTRRRVDLSGPELQRFDKYGLPVPDPQDVVVDGDFAYVTSANAILRVSLLTGSRSFFSLGNPGNQNVPPSGTQSAGSISIDRAQNRLVACDRQLKALVLVDLASGVQTTVVRNEATTGLRRSLAFDPLSGDVYSIHETIRRIDPDDGTITVVSEPGSGPDITPGSGAAVSADGAQLFVADLTSHEIVEVDLATGARRVRPGSGPALADPRDVELDQPRNRLLVVDAALDAIVAFDLATGARTVLSPITVGDGPPLHDLADIEFDPAARLLGLRAGEVVAIDGPARTSVVPIGTAGHWLRLACDDGGLVYVIGDDPVALIELDEATLATRVVATDFEAPAELVLDAGRPYILDTVWQTSYQELWRIDPATGAAESASGSLPILRPARLERDALNGSFIGLPAVATQTEPGYRVVRYDPATGTHADLGTYPPNWAPSGPAVPPPPRFIRLEQATIDALGRALYLVSTDRVLRFDLESGTSEPLPLSGVPVRNAVSAAYDAARGLVLVADADWGGILAVDARTGATVLLAR